MKEHTLKAILNHLICLNDNCCIILSDQYESLEITVEIHNKIGLPDDVKLYFNAYIKFIIKETMINPPAAAIITVIIVGPCSFAKYA